MRLEQILKNLISNAVKFTSKGSVTLTIAKSGVDGKLLDFIVTDTGIGIAKNNSRWFLKPSSKPTVLPNANTAAPASGSRSAVNLHVCSKARLL
jgi:light-regulated signal transduction histidine kinase (bacteriophytochrome)